MKIAVTLLITIVVMVRLSFVLTGCGKKSEIANIPAPAQKKAKELKDIQTLANGDITFNMKDKLGKGMAASVYAGQTEDGTRVAVKLFNDDTKSLNSYSIELKCYEKLGATTGVNCKIYGIPPILYHGHGPDASYRVLVMERYNSSLKDLRGKNIEILDPEKIFLAEMMVIAIKYMHWKGVQHGDIFDGNIMIDGNQAILIDYGFNVEKKVAEGYDMLYMFQAIFDFEEFLEHEVHDVAKKLPNIREEIINKLNSRNVINSKYVERIVDFYIEIIMAIVKKSLPDYDKLYGILKDALQSGGNHSEPIIFHWLSDAEKADARKIPIVKIDSIKFKKLRIF